MGSKQKLAKLMAGEIVLSEEPGSTIRKWRNEFKISQKELAEKLEVTSSVISDYEGGRRKSPGINVVRRIIDTLIAVDEERGGPMITKFGSLLTGDSWGEVVHDIRELTTPINAMDFCDKLKADVIACDELIDRELYGYSVVDSLKAILEFSPLELARIYGSTTQRAVVFSRVSTGRSPMVAIRVTNLKPSIVVIHGTDIEDPVAIKLAEVERIPLAISRMGSLDEILQTLRTIE